MQTLENENRTQVQNRMDFSRYGIEPILLRFGSFKVTKYPICREDGSVREAGAEYLVDVLAGTCACPSWARIQERSGGGPCKHLLLIRRLISFQVSIYGIEQDNVKTRVRFGSLTAEQGREQGQKLADAAWALQAIANNIWGNGEMMVPAEYDGRRAEAVRAA